MAADSFAGVPEFPCWTAISQISSILLKKANQSGAV